MQPNEMSQSVRAMFHVVGVCFAALLTLSAAAAEDGAIDRIVVEKSQRRMDLMSGDTVVRSYGIALGSAPEGDKQQEGDGKTPEGDYTISGRNKRSSFHLSLRISYPSAADRERARRQGASPGGDIMIHGLPNGMGLIGKLHRLRDWTEGCIAVTNPEIEEIWRLVQDGTPVQINP